MINKKQQTKPKNHGCFFGPGNGSGSKVPGFHFFKAWVVELSTGTAGAYWLLEC